MQHSMSSAELAHMEEYEQILLSRIRAQTVCTRLFFLPLPFGEPGDEASITIES